MKYLILSLLSGIISGSGSIILKFLFGSYEIFSLIFNPIFIFSLLMGAGGFFLTQLSLRKEKSSHVSLVATSSTNVIVILGGFFFLKEIISLSQFLGIVLVMISVCILITKS